MTLNQIITNIINTPDKGRSTRARTFTKRQIAFWVRDVRNFLITKDVEKMGEVPPTYEQDLGCWPLTTVDQADCPSYLWGDNVKKAVFPQIVDIKGNKGLVFCGLIDKRTAIYVPMLNMGSLDDHVPYKGKKNITGYMIGRDTIYLKGEGAEKLCTINIRGIFEDPTLVSYYDEVGKEYCYDWDKTNYPLPSDLEHVLYDMVFNDFIMKFAGAPKDNTNKEVDEALV